MDAKTLTADDPFVLAGRTFGSRLLTGTGKYASVEQTRLATEAAGAEIVTVAIRRTPLVTKQGEPGMLDVLSPKRYTLLPNTAGCSTAEEALRTCRLARELLDGHKLVKLEIVGDAKTLYPDMRETFRAAQMLVEDGFDVMVYTTSDPVAVKQMEATGVVAVMPLGSPLGSGLGIQNAYNIREIVENSTVPVLVDAGIGTPSEAARAMELGCDGVLMNSAIAHAKDPVRMATAMKHAVIAGRLAWLAGRMPRRRYASASSPETGVIA